jgi:hypothetical protein
MRAHGAALAVAGLMTLGACASDAGDLAGPDDATTSDDATAAEGAPAPDGATGSGVGEFAATSDYLADVARGADGESYRVAVDMTMHGRAPGEADLDVGGQMMTGEVAGDVSSMVLDMRSMMEDMGAGEVLASDLTVSMVTDGTTLYVQAPFFRAIADLAYSEGATADDLGPLAEIAGLGDDEWGSVDLTGLSMAEVAQTTGAQGVSTDVFLDMAASGSDVEDLGTQEIRGVETHGLGAVSTYEDMLTAQGITADEFDDQLGALGSAGGGPTDEEMSAVLDVMLAMEVPLEVWVDADDHVRRVTLELDMRPVIESLAEIDPTAEGVEMSMDMSMDMFDYGEPIEIEVPTGATDVTDEFLELMEQGGVGTGPGLGQPTFS